jgi:hypothetical protein
MLFWKLPNDKYLAFIPRTGSTAWGQAILDAFYPAEKIKQENATTPDGELAGPQYVIPKSRDPQSGQLLGVIRNPIERFRGGFSRAAKGRTVDDLLADLKVGNNPVNIHIRPVTVQFAKQINNIKWYVYETQLADLAKDIGLSSVPDSRNESDEADKPILNDSQLSELNAYYADDIALYNRIET